MKNFNSAVVLGWILEENGVPTWTLKSRKIKKTRFKKMTKKRLTLRSVFVGIWFDFGVIFGRLGPSKPSKPHGR